MKNIIKSAIILIFLTGTVLSHGQQTGVNEVHLQGIWLCTMKVNEHSCILNVAYKDHS